MIELAKHIEVLLLENDCVIVPGLGGFIAHNRPATWRTDSGEFFPPLRSIRVQSATDHERRPAGTVLHAGIQYRFSGCNP